MFTSEELNQPISSDTLSGENLEYDSLYMGLESLISVSEQDGGQPNWRQLEKDCLALWKKTRDLRLATYLTVAGTELYGLQGLLEGLKTIHYLVEEMWEDFYPQLDPDEENDPLERLNILAMLSPEPGAFNDPVMFLTRLRTTKLVPSLSYTVRDVMIAHEEIESDTPLDMALIEAEMMSVSLDVLQAQADMIDAINAEITAVSELMDSKMQGGYSLSMTSLQKELKRFSSFYNKQLQVFGSAEQEVETVENQEAEESASVPASVAVARPQGVNLSTLKAANRAEALLLLRKSAEYFRAEEPTSPVPFLINRALRLAEMNFMDLLADIAPDALSRGRDILGANASDENNF